MEERKGERRERRETRIQEHRIIQVLPEPIYFSYILPYVFIIQIVLNMTYKKMAAKLPVGGSEIGVRCVRCVRHIVIATCCELLPPVLCTLSNSPEHPAMMNG